MLELFLVFHHNLEKDLKLKKALLFLKKRKQLENFANLFKIIQN